MPRYWEFQLRTRVQFGRGALRYLGEAARRFGRRALLVGYRGAPALEETYNRAIRTLEKAEISVAPYREVEGDPDAELPGEGARAAIAAQADVVIGLGGGSVLDAAKGIAAMARTRGRLWDFTEANPESRPIPRALPMIAVPTTAGTGSEVSSVAVFRFEGQGSSSGLPLKASVSGGVIQPKVALVDPELAIGTPPEITAASAADALAHAIESCISRRANPVTSVLAARAVRLIVDGLPQALNDPADVGPRESLALAATLAGAAFTEAGVTVTHALAHGLGALLGTPHALAVGVCTPINLRYNFESCVTQLAELADALGLAGDTPRSGAERFVQRIVELLRSAGLPERVSAPEGAGADLVDRLVSSATESTSIALTLNPRKVDAAALGGLFEEVLRPR